MSLVKKTCYIFVAILLIQTVSTIELEEDTSGEENLPPTDKPDYGDDIVKITTASSVDDGAFDRSKEEIKNTEVPTDSDGQATTGVSTETPETTTVFIETTTKGNGASDKQLTFSLIFVLAISLLLLQ